MNRTEIKAHLKDIIGNAEYTIKNLENKRKWLESAISKIEDLKNHLSEHVEDVFDPEELMESITNEIFTAALEEIHDAAEELKDEIESYADELSEARAEKIYERYEDLDIVVEKFNQSDSEYYNIDDAIEHIEEAIILLKGMLK